MPRHLGRFGNGPERHTADARSGPDGPRPLRHHGHRTTHRCHARRCARFGEVGERVTRTGAGPCDHPRAAAPVPGQEIVGARTAGGRPVPPGTHEPRIRRSASRVLEQERTAPRFPAGPAKRLRPHDRVAGEAGQDTVRALPHRHRRAARRMGEHRGELPRQPSYPGTVAGLQSHVVLAGGSLRGSRCHLSPNGCHVLEQ